MLVARLNNDYRPALDKFLHSFRPSLLYLLPAFLRDNVMGYEDVLDISTWPRENIATFFNQMRAPEGTADGLTPSVVQSLVVRLHNNRCTCDKCPDPLPCTPTCSAMFVPPSFLQTS
jgi:hypothetical protein